MGGHVAFLKNLIHPCFWGKCSGGSALSSKIESLEDNNRPQGERFKLLTKRSYPQAAPHRLLIIRGIETMRLVDIFRRPFD